jgi:predicted DNA-binding transcriptional regulator YafY
MEILKFGADVEVLGPASLRDRVAAALGEALTRYAGS